MGGILSICTQSREIAIESMGLQPCSSSIKGNQVDVASAYLFFTDNLVLFMHTPKKN